MRQFLIDFFSVRRNRNSPQVKLVLVHGGERQKSSPASGHCCLPPSWIRASQDTHSPTCIFRMGFSVKPLPAPLPSGGVVLSRHAFLQDREEHVVRIGDAWMKLQASSRPELIPKGVVPPCSPLAHQSPEVLGALSCPCLLPSLAHSLLPQATCVG